MEIRKRDSGLGFTLLELMTVVSIAGILASVGIPTFMNYRQQVKWSEAYQMLGDITKGAQAYYLTEHRVSQALVTSGSAAAMTSCIVQSFDTEAGATVTVNDKKRVPNLDNMALESFQALGLQPVDPLYLWYGVIGQLGVGGLCGRGPNFSHYTIMVIGDVDADAAVGFWRWTLCSNDANELFICNKEKIGQH